MPRIPAFSYARDGARARTRESQEENNERHSFTKKTQMFKLEGWTHTDGRTHTKGQLWSRGKKRQLWRIWANTHISPGTVTAGMSFLSHSNNTPNTQMHPCVPEIQTKTLRLQTQAKVKLSKVLIWISSFNVSCMNTNDEYGPVFQGTHLCFTKWSHAFLTVSKCGLGDQILSTSLMHLQLYF